MKHDERFFNPDKYENWLTGFNHSLVFASRTKLAVSRVRLGAYSFTIALLFAFTSCESRRYEFPLEFALSGCWQGLGAFDETKYCFSDGVLTRRIIAAGQIVDQSTFAYSTTDHNMDLVEIESGQKRHWEFSFPTDSTARFTDGHLATFIERIK